MKTGGIAVSCIVVALALALFPAPAGASVGDGLVTASAISTDRNSGSSLGDAHFVVQSYYFYSVALPKFTYAARMTNGKDTRIYRALRGSYGSKGPIIYKARIYGSKLYLTGIAKNQKTGKKYRVYNKAYKLTGSTRYYRHYRYEGNVHHTATKSTVQNFTNYMSRKHGGEIYFDKKGRTITALSVG